MRRTGKSFFGHGSKVGVIVCLATVISVALPVIHACEWSYAIWGIRTKPADPLFRFVRDGKAGYIDSSGKIVIQPTLPDGGGFFGEFHEGLLVVRDRHGSRYMNHSGTVAFRVDSLLARDFSEGLAPASKDNHSSKWGFIDRTGRFAIPPLYWWVDPFSEGLARVSLSREVGNTGYIDSHGNFIVPPHLSYGSDFHEGRAAVIIDGPCQITNGGSCARAEFLPTKTHATYDCRYSFIDKTGNPISDLRFDDAKNFSEGLAPVRIGSDWGYVDMSGRISISPQFESAEPFSEGLAAVRQNGKVGFINRSGSFVIAPQFDSADSFSDGRALVTESNRGTGINRFIDKTGKPAFPGEFAVATSFTYGLAHVALDRRLHGPFAWINTSGQPVFTYTER